MYMENSHRLAASKHNQFKGRIRVLHIVSNLETHHVWIGRTKDIGMQMYITKNGFGMLLFEFWICGLHVWCEMHIDLQFSNLMFGGAETASALVGFGGCLYFCGCVCGQDECIEFIETDVGRVTSSSKCAVDNVGSV